MSGRRASKPMSNHAHTCRITDSNCAEAPHPLITLFLKGSPFTTPNRTVSFTRLILFVRGVRLVVVGFIPLGHMTPWWSVFRPVCLQVKVSKEEIEEHGIGQREEKCEARVAAIVEIELEVV